MGVVKAAYLGPETEDVNRALAKAEADSRIASVSQTRQLTTRRDALKKTADALAKDTVEVRSRMFSWGAVFQAAAAQAPDGVTLASIGQAARGGIASNVEFQGVAREQADVFGYAAKLRDTKLFTRVAVANVGSGPGSPTIIGKALPGSAPGPSDPGEGP